MKTQVRKIIEQELACGTLVTLATRLEESIIALIRGEFAHERRWRGFTSRTLEQRLTEPEEDAANDGPTPPEAA